MEFCEIITMVLFAIGPEWSKLALQGLSLIQWYQLSKALEHLELSFSMRLPSVVCGCPSSIKVLMIGTCHNEDTTSFCF